MGEEHRTALEIAVAKRVAHLPAAISAENLPCPVVEIAGTSLYPLSPASAFVFTAIATAAPSTKTTEAAMAAMPIVRTLIPSSFP